MVSVGRSNAFQFGVAAKYVFVESNSLGRAITVFEIEGRIIYQDEMSEVDRTVEGIFNGFRAGLEPARGKLDAVL